jgi:hypothetical protein
MAAIADPERPWRQDYGLIAIDNDSDPREKALPERLQVTGGIGVLPSAVDESANLERSDRHGSTPFSCRRKPPLL